jgi:hypothetical protein
MLVACVVEITLLVLIVLEFLTAAAATTCAVFVVETILLVLIVLEPLSDLTDTINVVYVTETTAPAAIVLVLSTDPTDTTQFGESVLGMVLLVGLHCFIQRFEPSIS